MAGARDIQSELIGSLLPDATKAVDALNREGAGDVYAVAIIANAGFFSGLGFASNTVTHLAEMRDRVDDRALGTEYLELSAAEWNRYEWSSFAQTNEYLAQLEELWFEDQLPFEDDDTFARVMVGVVVEVLRRLNLRQRLRSPHADDLYIGLGYSNPGDRERSLMLTAGEALNDERWNQRLRTLYGNL